MYPEKFANIWSENLNNIFRVWHVYSRVELSKQNTFIQARIIHSLHAC